MKNAAGEVMELRCTYDPATRGGNAPDGRKVQGDDPLGLGQPTRCRPKCGSTIRCSPRPSRTPRDFAADLNPDSLEVLTDCTLEPRSGRPQCRGGRCSSSGRAISVATRIRRPDQPVFNRTVGLRDTWAKVRPGEG